MAAGPAGKPSGDPVQRSQQDLSLFLLDWLRNRKGVGIISLAEKLEHKTNGFLFSVLSGVGGLIYSFHKFASISIDKAIGQNLSTIFMSAVGATAGVCLGFLFWRSLGIISKHFFNILCLP